MTVSASMVQSPIDHYQQELFRCIQCGDCSGICPVGYLMDYPPSRIIAAIRSGTYDRVMASEGIWLCISCSACTTVCPAQIKVTDQVMTKVKEERLLAGQVPEELQTALENTQRYGNPLGESPRKRLDWIKGHEDKVTVLSRSAPEIDFLWYVGDYAAYHPRVQVSSLAFAEILNRLQIRFGILGSEEFSDGDSQRLAGESGLFEMMAEKNGRAFSKFQFQEIITTDPHAYNAIKNEYPKLEIRYTVRHYTEFLAERIENLKLLLKKPLNAKVTFHDPCYLGRVNKIFDAPRDLLTAIPGVTLVEMTHNRANSYCCGGGGGGMWMDGFFWEKAKMRPSEWRVREALKAGASILAVACPYEIPRFEDAIKTLGKTEELKVKDVSELLLEAMS